MYLYYTQISERNSVGPKKALFYSWIHAIHLLGHLFKQHSPLPRVLYSHLTSMTVSHIHCPMTIIFQFVTGCKIYAADPYEWFVNLSLWGMFSLNAPTVKDMVIREMLQASSLV